MDEEKNVEGVSQQNNNPQTQLGTAPVVSMPTNVSPKLDSKPGGSYRLLMVLGVVLLVAAAGISGYLARGPKVSTQKAELASLHTKVADLQKTMYDLPASAMKVSDCIPNMGYHYLVDGADKEYGPFYLVNKEKKIIGLEYMAAFDMYTKIAGAPGGLEILEKESPAMGMKFDHIEFSRMPLGHEGLEQDHIDLHMYTVDADVVKNACN